MKKTRNDSKKPPIKKCAGCMGIIDSDNNNHYRCKFCKKLYHALCLNVTSSQNTLEEASGTSWECPDCKNSKLRGGDNTNTPIRSIGSTSQECDATQNVTIRRKAGNESSPGIQMTSINDIRVIIQEVIDNMLPTIIERINIGLRSIVREELKCMKEDLCSMERSVEFLNEQYELSKIECNKQLHTVHELKSECDQLQSTVQQLTSKLNDMEQYNRATNIELQCVPEHKNENLITTTLQVAKVISCAIKESDIHHCTRIAKLNRQNSRPRSIIVKFATPRIRDTFIAQAIMYNKRNPNDKLNTKLVGIAGDSRPIYVAEHLSQGNKTLHAAARLKGKELKYKYVWIKQGRIFMRKDDTSDHVFVRNMSVLSSLQ